MTAVSLIGYSEGLTTLRGENYSSVAVPNDTDKRQLTCVIADVYTYKLDMDNGPTDERSIKLLKDRSNNINKKKNPAGYHRTMGVIRLLDDIIYGGVCIR